MKKLSGLLLLCVLALHVGRAKATDLHDVITDVTITSWNAKDGLPSALITALAQDRDGYLWVGSRQGLFRFDGVRFVPWGSFASDPLPNPWVRSLLVARSGDIWVGFGSDGQIARITDGHVAAFTSLTGPGAGAVQALAEDGDGVVWAGTNRGLYVFTESRWSRADGIPQGAVVGLYTDRAGALHVASAAGVFQRLRGAAGFDRISSYADTYGSFAQGADGTVWVTDPLVGYHAIGGGEIKGLTRQGRGVQMLVDRKGNLWTGTGGQGLWRTRAITTATNAVERTSSLTGLLGDGVYSLLEDRDGNIWAGTTEGLNRITQRTIEQVIDLGLVRAVDMEPDGRIWVGTVDKLFSFSGADRPRVEIPVAAEMRALDIDAHGLWLVTDKGVSRIGRDGRESRLHWPTERRAGTVEGLVLDRLGGLWLVTEGLGIVHWTGREAEPLVLPPEVGSARVTAAFVDRKHRAWFAFSNGRLVITTADNTVTLLPESASALRVIRTIAEDSDGRVWLGGDRTLTMYDGVRFVSLQASDRFPVGTITAIVPDDKGAVWFGAPIGVVHLGRDEFERAAADPAITPRYAVYNRSDGVAGTPVAVPFNRGAVRTLEGRLWFVTTRGITVIDPHMLEAHGKPAPVRIEGALADERRMPVNATVTLPAGTSRLEIDYTVVNLTAPLRTRFKYRLEPFDRDWVEAGTRRQAFYTNLKPGEYVFHVAAYLAGGDAGSEASWPLAVAPMFYQTLAFAVLASLVGCLMVLGGWQLRERHLRKQFSMLIAERARLGREIHDTLLQGLVAIALQFDSLAHELSPSPVSQQRFFRLRDRVEEYIREARRSIWDLHTQVPHRNLVESLRRAGEFATEGRDISFSLEVRGTPYECPARVEEQVVRIAQEASLNSVRHAAPRRLRIVLLYEDVAVTLKVEDDGRGFESREAKGGGHLGISSMQERAKSVGGALTLVTAPGQGTEITAVLPIAS